MVRQAPTTRQADSKGRISLGQAFANRVVLIEDRGDEIIIRPSRVIPEREAWLYENPKALDAVRRGLEQARAGRLTSGPDLKKAKAVADQLQDE